MNGIQLNEVNCVTWMNGIEGSEAIEWIELSGLHWVNGRIELGVLEECS